MPDDIYQDAVTGQAAMVSLRQNPWHGLGTVVQNEMTDDDVLNLTGLGWDVELAPVYSTGAGAPTDDNPVFSQVEGFRALRRADNQSVLSIVSDKFRPFQNREMVQLMRRLASGGPLIWETFGALGSKAQTIWALARLPELTIELGNDRTNSYMLLVNGHGNGRALSVLPTMIRVVCANTERMASGGRAGDRQRLQNRREGRFEMANLSTGYAALHTRGLDDALDQIVRAYANVQRDHQRTKEIFEMLAEQSVSDNEAAEYWEMVFQLPAAPDESARSRTMRENKEGARREALQRIWNSGTNAGLETANTAYTAYQAAIEYVDHEIYARSSRTRFASAFQGSGAALKARAWHGVGELFLGSGATAVVDEEPDVGDV